MERTTLKAAADALSASVRTALQCIGPVEVLNSGWAHGVPNTLRVVSRGAVPPGVILLRRSDRSPFLHLRVDLEYAVIFSPGDAGRLQYRAAATRYVYRVLDLDDHELFAFHWHPVGVSDVRVPHLHVSAARSVPLPGRSGSPGLKDLNLGKLHFPTHRIEVAELVHFLIVELGVGPRRRDWESVLEGSYQ